MKYTFNTNFASAYGSSTYNGSTYNGTTATSTSTPPAGTGTTGLPATLADTGFQLIAGGTVACLIIVTALFIRFSRHKPTL